jgi:uncharacterized protein
VSEDTFPWERYAFIAELAETAPKGWLGRTALMKCAYFLQVLKDVPLGYNFSLYTYGPFDASVLYDLASAETLEAVKVRTISHPNGYGYDIRPSSGAREIKSKGAEFLAAHRDSINWVIDEFKDLNAAQLELASTMVYVDREAVRAGEPLPLEEITRRVLAIKPRFDFDRAYNQAESLRCKGLLRSVQL